jgi:hypothetical protein
MVAERAFVYLPSPSDELFAGAAYFRAALRGTPSPASRGITLLCLALFQALQKNSGTISEASDLHQLCSELPEHRRDVASEKTNLLVSLEEVLRKT